MTIDTHYYSLDSEGVPRDRHGRPRQLRLIIIGHAQHGKDTVAEMLRDNYGFTFMSSSRFAVEKAVWPIIGHRFKDFEDMFERRALHRAEWFEAIAAYNRPDASRLGRELFAKYDMYVGMRNPAEFHALRNLRAFDYAIWVDASKRKPMEDASSMGLEPWMADFYLDNNGSLIELGFQIQNLFNGALGPWLRAMRVEKVL